MDSPNPEALDTYYTGIASFDKLSTVGCHPIVDYFSFVKSLSDGDLAARIIAVMEESRLPCNSFDVLRIGNAPLQDRELPVKLLIKVEPGQVNWEDGMNLARRCRSELKRLGLNDVHCEVLEAQVRTANNVSSSSSGSSEPASFPPPFFWSIGAEWVHEWKKLILPFTPNLGQCIASPNTLPTKGSTGLYLRISTKEGIRHADYIITCPTAVEPITDYKGLIQVLQPANYEEIKEELDATKERLEDTMEHLKLKKEFSELTKSANEYLNLCQQNFEQLEAFLAYYDRTANDRKIGYITASPPISAKHQPSRQITRRDWAAIRIDQPKFCLGDNAPPKNRFCIEGLERTIRNNLKATGQTVTPEDDFLTIDKYIIVESLQDHISMTQRRNSRTRDDKALHLNVFKSGFKTGTTHGYLNEIGSYTRDGLYYSQNLCIPPQGKEKFSEDGDSGSLISMLYRSGDDKTHEPVVVAAGLLWGGCNAQKAARDIIYAIPLEHVLEDVKQFLGQRKINVDEVEFSNLEVFAP
ncbi:hypothetical protein GGR58DRAFT_514123 [Xylaria digitata]|nr:hypothetical protein GGR58DRAFT_514123 [Xylaria digitata]